MTMRPQRPWLATPKRLVLIFLGPLLIMVGCDHGYILSREDTERIGALPEFAHKDVKVSASPVTVSEDSGSRDQPSSLRVVVTADRLDLPRRKKLDDQRFLIPIKRPIGLLATGGIFLGIGVMLSVGAAVNQADQSCEKHDDKLFDGPCWRRGLITFALTTAGVLRSLIGIGMLIGGQVKWSPEIGEQ